MTDALDAWLAQEDFPDAARRLLGTLDPARRANRFLTGRQPYAYRSPARSLLRDEKSVKGAGEMRSRHAGRRFLRRPIAREDASGRRRSSDADVDPWVALLAHGPFCTATGIGSVAALSPAPFVATALSQ